MVHSENFKLQYTTATGNFTNCKRLNIAFKLSRLYLTSPCSREYKLSCPQNSFIAYKTFMGSGISKMQYLQIEQCTFAWRINSCFFRSCDIYLNITFDQFCNLIRIWLVSYKFSFSTRTMEVIVKSWLLWAVIENLRN